MKCSFVEDQGSVSSFWDAAPNLCPTIVSLVDGGQENQTAKITEQDCLKENSFVCRYGKVFLLYVSLDFFSHLGKRSRHLDEIGGTVSLILLVDCNGPSALFIRTKFWSLRHFGLEMVDDVSLQCTFNVPSFKYHGNQVSLENSTFRLHVSFMRCCRYSFL